MQAEPTTPNDHLRDLYTRIDDAQAGVDVMVAKLTAIDPHLVTLAGPGGWTTETIVAVIGFVMTAIELFALVRSAKRSPNASAWISIISSRNETPA
jgi:hypothetical protein